MTILDSEGSNGKQLSDLSNNQQTSATQAKLLEAAEKSNTSHDQGKQASKEKPALKKATLEMMRKDWQKQQQTERQLNKPSSSNKTSANTKDKPQKKQTNKPNTSENKKGRKMNLVFRINLMRRVTRAKWSLLTLLITLAIVIKYLGHQFSRHLHSFQS